VGGLLGGLDTENAIQLVIGKADGVLSVLRHPREDTWDRDASVLGFWVWMDIGSSSSSGRPMDHGRGCGSGSSAVESEATSVRDVADGPSAFEMRRCGHGTTLPWAAHPVTLVYVQRRVRCRTCGIRTERVGFADGHARITRRLRQLIGLDCQSMPTSHAALRHGVSWSKARRAEKAFLSDWDHTRPRRPRHLGADEIHPGKRQRFDTVLSDLVHGEVIGLAPERTEESLAVSGGRGGCITGVP
jgi:hypothetical protein